MGQSQRPTGQVENTDILKRGRSMRMISSSMIIIGTIRTSDLLPLNECLQKVTNPIVAKPIVSSNDDTVPESSQIGFGDGAINVADDDAIGRGPDVYTTRRDAYNAIG